MIEKMARALAADWWETSTQELIKALWPDRDEYAETLWEDFQRAAKAALTALLEPTGEMIEAATYRIDDGSKSMYATIFTAMIRQALSSAEQTASEGPKPKPYA